MGWDASPSRSSKYNDLTDEDRDVVAELQSLRLSGNHLGYKVDPMIGHNRESLELLTDLDWLTMDFHPPNELLEAAKQISAALDNGLDKYIEFPSSLEEEEAQDMVKLLTVLGNRGIGLIISY